MSVRALGAALLLGLGLAGIVVGPAGAADDNSPVELAIAVPIVVPASADEFLDAETLEQYTSEFGILTRELNAVYNRPVALGVDPRIIASIRLLGTSAPPSAVAWLQRLDSATNQMFSLGWADADATIQTQAGAGAVLQPEAFDFAIDPALFAPATATPAPTASPGDDEAPPALPSSDDILAWPYALTGIAWPRDDTVISTDLPAIVASGFTTTILSSDNVARDASGGPVSQIDGARVLVSDAAVSAGLRSATAAFLPADWDAAMAELTGAVSAAGGPLFATLDRTTLGSANRLAATLDALAGNPALQLVQLSHALASSPVGATIVDKPQPAERVARVSQMIASSNAERQFASVAADPALITSERRLALLGVLSAEWASDPDGWAEAADVFTTASTELRNSVHLVTSSNFLLVADNDQYLPITVNNGLAQPVTVYITVRSLSSLLVIDQSQVELQIDANTQVKKNIPVRSLSNGVVDVSVSLTSPSNVQIGAPIFSEVNVQAGWETPIVVAIAVVVVIAFGVGLIRTVRRRRRDGRLEAADD